MKGTRRVYELTYILTSVLSSDQIGEVVSKITEAVENAGGVIKQVDQWGMRRLAYPVAKKRNGYFVNMYFKGPGIMVARLERLLTIDDHVLRYLTLAMDKRMLYAYDAKQRARAIAAAEESVAEGEAPEVPPELPAPPRPKYIDYKDTDFLRRFINEQGRMLPRRVTDVSARRQRAIARAIKRARHLAMLPYVKDAVK